jgi:Ca2+-binding EF-hand superfamily protein
MKKTGVISVSKLKSMLAALDFHLNSKELAIITKQVDPNQSGTFGFAELTAVMEDRLKEVDTYEDFVVQF